MSQLLFAVSASKQKMSLRNGLKDVQRRLRKGETGIVVFAGDVTPVEIMCHLPGVCESKDIPYVYTPSRQELGTAMGVKRGSLMVLVREHEDFKELYDEIKQEIKYLPQPLWIQSTLHILSSYMLTIIEFYNFT